MPFPDVDGKAVCGLEKIIEFILASSLVSDMPRSVFFLKHTLFGRCAGFGPSAADILRGYGDW